MSHSPFTRPPQPGKNRGRARALWIGVILSACAVNPPSADAQSVNGGSLTTDHWSFQPVKRPEVPAGGSSPVDGFILAKLREKGLEPSEEADRRTLIRRLYLVMHGVPPTPEEVEAFVNDAAPDAYARLVETVLASPRYGERWARHWLDVARYADSNGFETNRERKTAYPYRDYVIAAFNEDKPYDRFVREQLAGDAMGADAATGFIVAGPHDIVKSPDINLSLMQREDELADMVNTTGTAFLGLTMGCARCHNHKFDPVLQKDYFSMQAVFAGVAHGERALPRKLDVEEAKSLAALRGSLEEKTGALDALRKKSEAATGVPVAAALRPLVNARGNTETFAPVETTAARFVIEATNGGEACLDELEIYDESGANVALASRGAKATASSSLGGFPIHRLEHINDGLTGNTHSWIAGSNGTNWVRIDFAAPTKINRVVWSRDREGGFADRVATSYRVEVSATPDTDQWTAVAGSADREPFRGEKDPDAVFAKLPAEEAATARQLLRERNDLRKRIAEMENGLSAYLGTFSQPGKTYRLQRGDPLQKREAVSPDALTVLGSLGMAEDEPEQNRRERLGEWIASPKNPLTARVMVNRVWHYIFGTGIVDTPSDLGVNGSRPTHPELLDWLADEFVANGWSVKHMQRLILLSDAFRQASPPREDALKIDSDARFLWRYPPRRMEAEAIRDSMLATSGALNPEAGGPGFYLMNVEEENVMHYHQKEKFTPAEFRRMVYQFRIRQTDDGVFGSFDCPDGSLVTPRRSRSNTPLQALNLFNSRFVLQQADILAERLGREAGGDPGKEVERAFHLMFARQPDGFEKEQSVTLIREEGLRAFCRALYNSSEFLFVF